MPDRQVVVQQMKIRPSRILPALVCISIALAFAAHVRNGTWRTPFTLWSDVAEKSPNRPTAHHFLGNYFSYRNRFGEAFAEYDRALELNRFSIETYFSMARTLEKAGMGGDAVYYYGVYCRNAQPTARRQLACEREMLLSQGR